MEEKTKRLAGWLLPGFMVLVIDRIFKVLFNNVDLSLIPGILALRSAKNTGMALGMFEGNALLLFLFSIALVAICIFSLRKYSICGLARFSVSLIAGGALANMADRLILGYVIDMIDVECINFYIFNVADIGVVCGAVLCGISLLFRPGEWKEK